MTPTTEPTPSVSVVVPAYNAAGTIERALASALSQTCVPCEVLVVDDCSTDGTAALVAELAATFPLVRLLSTGRNSGPGRARNVAIAEARGDWIALLDADDAWVSDRLDVMLRVGRDCDMVADNLLAYDSGLGEVVGRFSRWRHRGPVTLPAFLGEADPVDLALAKPLVRRDFLHRNAVRYDETMRVAEDMMFCCDVLCLGGRFRVVEHAGYVYTTPWGQRSRVKSPHSHTLMNEEAIVQAMRRLVIRHDLVARPALLRAVERRIRFYRKRRHWDAFAARFVRRDYPGLAATVLKHPSVTGFLLRRLRNRLVQ